MTYSAAIGRILALLVLTLLLSVQSTGAAPAPPHGTDPTSANAPDWLSADSAAQLDLGFPVLVPDYVPGPFGGEPSITAYDGFYSLYWLVPGTPPTYLQITGEVGGSIPDFSYYDRNNQLVVNASVRGYDAYHDLTPVYDRVYWQEGDVVYTVDSLNLSDTDSLSLANSLSPIVVDTSSGSSDAGSGSDSGDSDTTTGGDNAAAATLSAPATVQSGGSGSLDISGVTDATLSADAGSFAGSGTDTLNDVGASTVSWQAPATDTDLSVLFILADPSNGDWLATAKTTVTAAPASDTTTNDETDPANTDPAPTSPPQSSAALTCDPTVNVGANAAVTLTGGGDVIIDASSGGWPADPNGDFDAAAGGGTELNGALSGGPVNLVWTAPDDGSKQATITVSDSDGDTLASCTIAIRAVTESSTSATTNATRETPRIASFFGDGTGLGNIGVSGKGSGDGTSIDSTLVQNAPRNDQPGSGGSGSGDKNERGDATGMGRTATESPKPTAPANQPATTTSTPAAAASAPASAATPTKRRTPAAAPTATLAPSSGPNGMVAKVIGPDGGTLESPAGAKLVIPPGALKEDATVTIVPVADAKLPVAENVEFVPGSAFDVTVAAPTGNSIEKLEKPATLTVSLKPEQWRKGITLYWIDGATPKPLDASELTENAISADTNHFSRFAAGLPTTASSSNRDPVPFLLGALGVIVLLLAIVGVITAQHRRRPPSIPTRRNRTR